MEQNIEKNEDTNIMNIGEYNINNVIFNEPHQGTYQKDGKKLTYYRMNITNSNNEKIIIICPKMYSFGVQENNKSDGYNCTFNLIDKVNEDVEIGLDDEGNLIRPTWEEMGADETELNFLNFLEELYVKCSENLTKYKKKCGLSNIKNLDDMKSLITTPWYFTNKITNGEYEPNYAKSPKIKIKLNSNYKDMSVIYTNFYDEDDNELKVLDYINEPFKALSAIQLDNVYIGDKNISIQVRMLEAVICPIEKNKKKLINRSTILKNIKDKK
jgi:hypothetical protein